MADMIIKYKGKKISVKARKLNLWGMTRGLMFRTPNCGNLFFDNFSGAIHSWFVFFDFLGVWMDYDNKAVYSKIIRPFSFYIKPKKKFAKLVEIPVNKQNGGLINFFVGKRNI